MKQLKAELKNCQELLAESCKQISSQTAEILTQKSIAELVVSGSQDDDRNEQIKCISCDFNARNKHLLNQHMNIQHKSETKSVCNACSKDFVSNEELELHMVADHSGDIDCSKCNKMFRTEQDVYDHSNSSCSEIIGLNKCHKCKRDVISKSALKKHVQSCQGKKDLKLCKNGDQCRYYRASRCSFLHPQKEQR